MTNLGASLGTALAGSVLILGLTNSFFEQISDQPAISEEVVAQAEVELSGGVPFISDAQVEDALAETDLSSQEADAVTDAVVEGRLAGLRGALAVLGLLAVVALFCVRLLPVTPVGRSDATAEVDGRGSA
jgi:hypothetical protein